MSREIALAFADNYPRPGFNCSKKADNMDTKSKQWLSWGNSWIEDNCGWRSVLLKVRVRVRVRVINVYLYVHLYT
jgi:hypothetical protein